MADLLLHSLAEFQDILLPLLDAVGVRSVVEIGVESGGFSQCLSEWACTGGRRHMAIDPDPAATALALFERSDSELYVGTSLAVLPTLAPADAYVVDGDHNYYTVANELRLIAERRDRDRPFPLVLLHDVGWPSGRRDTYYAAHTLPPQALHPFRNGGSVVPGRPNLVAGGFRLDYAVAEREGGAQNGVLTAVEDFRKDHPDLFYAEIPCIFGLGILADPYFVPWLAPLLAAYVDNPLLARLERNRLALFLRVLHLQGEIAAMRCAGLLGQPTDVAAAPDGLDGPCMI